MSNPKGCPSPDALRDYGQGRLSDFQSREIALHLEAGCAACLERIAAVEAEHDDLVDSLRRADGVEPVPDSALERLRAALADVAGRQLADADRLGLLAGEGGRIQIEEGEPVRFGGNGRISIAVDLEIGRPVALKQPLTSPNQEGSRQEQILREARITGLARTPRDRARPWARPRRAGAPLFRHASGPGRDPQDGYPTIPCWGKSGIDPRTRGPTRRPW